MGSVVVENARRKRTETYQHRRDHRCPGAFDQEKCDGAPNRCRYDHQQPCSNQGVWTQRVFSSSPVGNFVFRKTFGSLMARVISAPRFRQETNSMPRNPYWRQLDWLVGSWTEHRRYPNRLKIS